MARILIMPQITAGEAAKILGVSKRTLFRWEKEGKIQSRRDGILKVRVYDKDHILQTKAILDVTQEEKEHLAKLPQVREQVKAELFVQDVSDVRSGKEQFKLMDAEKATKAFDDEEAWLKKHQELLNEMFSYPRDRLVALGSVSYPSSPSVETNKSEAGVPSLSNESKPPKQYDL